MSDKKEKDYDPTLLRAVGNILAGVNLPLCTIAVHGDGIPATERMIIKGAVKTVLAAKKELKKQMEIE